MYYLKIESKNNRRSIIVKTVVLFCAYKGKRQMSVSKSLDVACKLLARFFGVDSKNSKSKEQA